MKKKKTKYEKPVNLNMEFDEAMERLAKADKKKVETNIKKQKK